MTVTLAEVLLVLCVVSPPYDAATLPVPAAVPVNVTEQLPDTNAQLVALNVPPVKVRENVTVPEGVLAGVVESVTVAVTCALQLVWPRVIWQLTLPTLVEVLSFVTVIVPEVPELPV